MLGKEYSEAGIQEMLESFQKMLRRIIKQNVQHEKDDIMQEALLAALIFLRNRKWEPQRASIWTVLWRIAKNKENDSFRGFYRRMKTLENYSAYLQAINQDRPRNFNEEILIEVELKEKMFNKISFHRNPLCNGFFSQMISGGNGLQISKILKIHPSRVTKWKQRIRHVLLDFNPRKHVFVAGNKQRGQ